MIRIPCQCRGVFIEDVAHLTHAVDMNSPDQGGQVWIRTYCPCELGNTQAKPAVGFAGADADVEIAVEYRTDQIAEQGAATANTGHGGVVIGAPESAVLARFNHEEDHSP